MKTFRIAGFAIVCIALMSVTGVCQAQGKDEWGTIKGQVIYTVPYKAEKADVTTDRQHCLQNGPLFIESRIVNPKSKGLKNVVVWLRPDTDVRGDPIPDDKIKPALQKVASKHHVIDQPCCQFIPRVVAARTGDTLEIKNSAPVPHNANYSGDPGFNVLIPAGKSHKLAAPLLAQSTPIQLKCDIHPWMQGCIRVFDHPYYAITDADGKFEIKDAPMGKWRLVYWHENGYHKGRNGILGEKIEVKGPTLELKPLDFEFPE